MPVDSLYDANFLLSLKKERKERGWKNSGPACPWQTRLMTFQEKEMFSIGAESN